MVAWEEGGATGTGGKVQIYNNYCTNKNTLQSLGPLSQDNYIIRKRSFFRRRCQTGIREPPSLFYWCLRTTTPHCQWLWSELHWIIVPEYLLWNPNEKNNPNERLLLTEFIRCKRLDVKGGMMILRTSKRQTHLEKRRRKIFSAFRVKKRREVRRFEKILRWNDFKELTGKNCDE